MTPTVAPTIPATHPVVRAMAQELAVEAHNLFGRRTWGVLDGWDELEDEAQETLIGVHSDLLTDLTRPASRDAWVRWLQSVPTVDIGGFGLNLRRDNPEALAAAVCAALETM